MPERDPRGYYALLGVQPDASTFDLRDAYRAKTYDLDPVRNSDPDAPAKLRALDAAYAVLSDRESRRSYDSVASPDAPAQAAAVPAGFTTPAPVQRRQLIACSRCGSTELPRQLAFRWVVSAVVLSFRNPVQGVFCARCAGKAALGCNAGTALLGWWGIPWGPIWSIAAIFSNAGGGALNRPVTSAITWNNALAFLDAGDKPAAYRAAQRVSGEHTADAGRLVDQLRPEVGQLAQPPDPWRSNGLRAAGLVALGFGLPSALFALLVLAVAAAPPPPPTLTDLSAQGFRFVGGPLNEEGRETTAFIDQSGGPTTNVLFIDSAPFGHRPTYAVANTVFDCARHTANRRSVGHYLPNGTLQSTDPETGPQAIEPDSALAAAAVVACGGAAPNPTVFQGIAEARQFAFNHTADVRYGPACERHLRSGAILEGSAPGRGFGHRLTMRNETADTAIVKVRDAASRSLVFSFLVLPHGEANIDGIHDGTYRIQYAQGNLLGRDCTRLVRIYSMREIQRTEPLVMRLTPTQRIAQEISYTLLPETQHGDAQAANVEADSFDR